jgi:oxygen-independent coproporphyrinogen-3 oxidase
MSIEHIKKLQPGSEAAISQLIADGLIEGPEAIAGKLLLTLKGRLLADAVVRALSS